MVWPGGSIVLANAGTALIWAGLLHLLIGNLIIGIGEAFILRRWFGSERWRSRTLMILGNYFSMLVGLVFIVSWLAGWFREDLYTLRSTHLLLYALAFVVSLVLEWPFVYGALQPEAGRLKRSIVASLVVQTISNVLVLLWYLPSTTSPQAQGWTLLPPEQVQLPPGVVMYYIGEEDGAVYRMAAGARPGEKICDLRSKDPREHLAFARSEKESTATLVSSVASLPVTIEKPVSDVVITPINAWPRWGEVPVLGSEREGDYYADVWPDSGLYLGRDNRFAVGLPYLRWAARNAVELPNGRVVLQLGQSQICLVDPKAKTAGVLVRGRGPAFALLSDPPATLPHVP